MPAFVTISAAPLSFRVRKLRFHEWIMNGARMFSGHMVYGLLAANGLCNEVAQSNAQFFRGLSAACTLKRHTESAPAWAQ